MMYKELVARLRDRARREDAYYEHGGDIINEAADAIEEQDMCYRHLERDYKDLCAYLPRWIPVAERLPENIDDEVLVCTEDYGKSCLGFVTVAIYDGSGWLECWKRKTYLTAVTHWMPLPKPPKEST